MYPHPDVHIELGRQRVHELRLDGAQPPVSPAGPRRPGLTLLHGRLFRRGPQPRIVDSPAPSRS